MRLGKPAQCVGAAVAVEDAAAGNEHRLLRCPQKTRHRVELDRLGLLRADANERRCKELRRKVVCLRLHVLRQGQRDRAALRRIGQHGDRARQSGEELGGREDAVEIARHRLEAVVGRDAAVVEILDLLQHGVRIARDEHVTGQQQHRQPVDVRGRRRRDQVGRAGADGRRARHHPPPEVRLREGDRRVRHRLLVVRAIGGEQRAMPVERLSQARRRCRGRRSPTRRRTAALRVRRRSSAARRESGPAPAPWSIGSSSCVTPDSASHRDLLRCVLCTNKELDAICIADAVHPNKRLALSAAISYIDIVRCNKTHFSTEHEHETGPTHACQ